MLHSIKEVSPLQPETVTAPNELGVDDDAKTPQTAGEYYVALPDGRLQRISYVSRQDVEAMKYFAKIQAENVEPLRGPIYAFSPLQELQFAPAKVATVAVASPLEIEAVPAVPVAAQLPSTTVTEDFDVQPRQGEYRPSGEPQKYQNQQPERYQQQQQQQVSPADAAYTTYLASYQTPTDSRYILNL